VAIVARSRTVFARDSFGAYAAECTAAASRTAAKTAKEGAKTSRRLAPSGAKRDPRPEHATPLKRTINWRMTGGSRAEWYATSGHALHVEFGTSATVRSANVKFFWDKQGRMFLPGSNMINHPGMGAQPYLRPAYAMVAQGKMMSIAKAEFP